MITLECVDYTAQKYYLQQPKHQWTIFCLKYSRDTHLQNNIVRYISPVKLLKLLGPKISHPLATMINQSFANGIFPSKLNIAKVVPIFKKGDPEISSNYRPLSHLQIFGKMYEKLMHKRSYACLKDCNSLYLLQFGFQENNSIDHALSSLTEESRSSLDNRRYGCGIFLDLQKAFDTVTLDILLTKVEHYGIGGNVLDWFKSYLSERRHFVSINGSSSSSMTTTCGAPKGSVHGPLLFLIYVNDLPNVSKKLKFIYLQMIQTSTVTVIL